MNPHNEIVFETDIIKAFTNGGYLEGQPEKYDVEYALYPVDLIGYFKAEPTDYILVYNNGKVARQGTGQSFWYWGPTTSIVRVPVATTDSLFVLNEITRDFQTVTLQGQITYRITQPETLAALLNFTINPQTRQYLSDDPSKVSQRIINLVQQRTRQTLSELSLEEALRSADTLARSVQATLQDEVALQTLGVVVLTVFFTAIRPTPEVAKALEAEQREALQRRADEAIFSRRAEAVAQERKIKQNELSTNIELEQRREELVALEGANARSLNNGWTWPTANWLRLNSSGPSLM